MPRDENETPQRRWNGKKRGFTARGFWFHPRQSRSTRSRTRDAADADSRTRASSVESADGDAWPGGGATATTDNGMRLPSNLDGAPGCGCRALLRRLAQWAARRL